MINILNTDLKTSITEITLKEFDNMNEILNDAKLTKMDKNLQIMKICGYKEDLRLVTLKDLTTFIVALNKQAEEDAIHVTKDLLNEIEINGRMYRFFESNPYDEIGGHESGMIQELPRKRGFSYITEAISILFKDIDLTINEHYDQSHIDHKTKLFGNLTLDLFYPYIAFIVKSIINNIEHQKNTEQLDHIINEAEKMNKQINETK